MTIIDDKDSKSLTYPQQTVERAERSLLCSPFNLHLLVKMRLESVPIKAIVGEVGVRNGYTKRPLSELAAENNLMWLIQVGVLRREVDGQGITDSFRLTPLGRQLVQNQGSVGRNPTWRDYFYNAFRWFRLPF